MAVKRFDPISAEDLRRLTVREVMTPDPLTLGGETSLSEAVDLMDQRGILHFPVVDPEGRLVGVLSERHIRDAQPSVLTLRDAEARRRALRATPVSRVYVSEPVTIEADATLRMAISRMRSYKAGCLPVLERGRLVGIVTSGDLIALLEAVLMAE